MATELKINSKEVLDEITALLQRLSEPRPLFAAIAQELATKTELSFFDEGPDWEALKPSTVAARGGNAHPILQVTGALARSFTSDHGDDFAAVGSNDPRAVWHQLGTKPYVIKPKNKKALAWAGGKHPVKKVNHPGLPARRMLPIDKNGNLTPSATESIMDILGRYVLNDL